MSQSLSIRDLRKTYAGSEHPVFDGFSVEVGAGELCAVMGASGVGKTTLLNCIAGLDSWEGGEIRVGGAAINPSDRTAMSLHRRARIGLAFQQPHLLPEFTLEENLALPLMLDGGPDAAQRAWIQELLGVVGLGDLAARHPNQLSGGQAARGGLARALVRKPALWLLDEPTGNLDPQTAEEVFGFLLRLHAELKPTTLLVTHNPDLAARCGRIVRLG